MRNGKRCRIFQWPWYNFKKAEGNKCYSPFCIGFRVWASINTSLIPQKYRYILDCAGGPFFYTLVHALGVVKVSWRSRNATVSFRNFIWSTFKSLSFAEVAKTYGQNDETKFHGCFSKEASYLDTPNSLLMGCV